MQRFAVLGHPIQHSYSPVMHEASFRATGFQGSYTKLDVPPETLEQTLTALAVEGYAGVNVTIPLKQCAVPLVQQITPLAAKIGAVNTIRFEADGSRSATNTDAPGFIAALTASYGSMCGRTALVCGCGGAGRAIAFALADAGAGAVLLLDAFAPQQAEALAAVLQGCYPQLVCRAVTMDAVAQADVIVQCTPSGLASCPAPALRSEQFHRGQFLFDIVLTASGQTPTMLEAQAAGVACCDGAGMLVEQGALAFEFWTGRIPDRHAMTEALASARKGLTA